MSDTSAILAANAAFYAAISTADIEAMARAWADADDISCIHPGWPVIVGRVAVIGSWRDILESPARPRITCHDPYPIVTGGTARILCVELVDGAPLAASNHFSLIGGQWRLVHHQASPIASIPDQAKDPSTTPSRIH
jgi:hypothetical protein